MSVSAGRHAAERLGRPTGEVRLVSSNPFDISGVVTAGMRAAWVNRAKLPFDSFDERPDLEVQTLIELADALAAPRR